LVVKDPVKTADLLKLMETVQQQVERSPGRCAASELDCVVSMQNSSPASDRGMNCKPGSAGMVLEFA